jgi:hypothetical protein
MISPIRCCEWIFTRAAPAPWNVPPGTVWHSEQGAMAMNIAPLRWLVLGDPTAWRDSALSAGAVEFDTSGRWQVQELARDSAALRAAVDVDRALERRACLATTVFDTPVILAGHGSPDLLLVCVPSSYAASFMDHVVAIDSRVTA